MRGPNDLLLLLAAALAVAYIAFLVLDLAAAQALPSWQWPPVTAPLSLSALLVMTCLLAGAAIGMLSISRLAVRI